MLHIIKRIIKESLDEALRDELPDYMINAVKNIHDYDSDYGEYLNISDKYLDMDVPEHTKLIPNVKIELNEPQIAQNFIKDIQEHFATSIETQFKKTQFYKKLKEDTGYFKIMFGYAVDLFKTKEGGSYYLKEVSLNNWGYNKFSVIKALKFLYSKEFTLLQSKDNNGKPNYVNEPTFSKNKSNLFTFIKSYNIAFPKYPPIDLNAIMNDRIFVGLREPIMNFEQNVNDLANSKLYLYITDKPADILRMSVSNFYSSCQNLYSGEYNEQLLSNVFDKNSKIAYLIFDTPYVDNQGNKHPFTPIARTIIRVGQKNKIMFDVTYPKKMENDFYDILEKYTELKDQGVAGDIYDYEDIGLPVPYMDKYNIKSNKKPDKNDPRVLALTNLGFELKNIYKMANTLYQIDDITCNVYTEDEFFEITLDRIRKNGLHIFYLMKSLNMSLSDLISAGILNKKAVYIILNIDDNVLDKINLTLSEYLKKQNLLTITDFDTLLDNRNKIISSRYASYHWYEDYTRVNINNLIKYFKTKQDIINIINQREEKQFPRLKHAYSQGYYIIFLEPEY